MRFYSFVTVLVLVIVQGLSAQSTESGGSIVVPPSPTAASLANQGSEKVQLYTGALNVQIPIHSLKSRELELPIYLSYNGSGNKVNDIASNVGTGWTLNANGVVSRVMRGLPDEYDGGMDLPSTGGTSVPAKGYLHPEVRGNSGLDFYDYFFASSTTTDQRKQLIEYSNKTGDYVSLGSTPKVWDTEPDEFNFNVGEYSGKFIFDKSGNVQIIPHQNLKITKVITSKTTLGSQYPSQQITSFEMIDPKGIKYTFGNTPVTSASSLTAVETTSYSMFRQLAKCGYLNRGFQQTSISTGFYIWDIIPFLMFEGGNNKEAIIASYTKDFQTFTSAWYLTRMESASGDYMNFSYANDDIKYMISQEQDLDQINLERVYDGGGNMFYASLLDATSGIDEAGTTSGWQSSTIQHQPQNVTFSTSYNTVKSKRLTNITTAGGSIVGFSSNELRYDLFGGKMLNTIAIFNNEGFLHKEFTFDYTYTGNDLDEHVYYIPFLNTTGEVGYWPLWEYRYGNQEWADTWLNMATADHYRLFLTSVNERGSSNESIQTHSFNYNFDEILPRRLSYKQDWWGYYNTNSAGHRIPKLNYSDAYPESHPFYFSWFQGGASGVHRDPNFNGANLGANLAKMQAGILKEIIYPTGGKKQFIYAQNKVAEIYNGGGFVVNEIRSYPDANSSYFESTSYTYKEGNYAWNVQQMVNLFQLPTETWGRANVNLSSSSMVSTYLTKGGVVGYGLVEESRAQNGKTQYHFSNPTDYANTQENVYESNKALCTGCNGYPFHPLVDADHKRGNIEFILQYNSNGGLLAKTENTYSVNPQGFIATTTYAIKPGKKTWQGIPLYFAGFYKYTNDWIALTNQTTYVYDQVDPGNESKKITLTTDYSYLPVSSVLDLNKPAPDLLPRKIIQTLPTEEKLITENKYVLDYSRPTSGGDVPAGGIIKLMDKNMDDALIETITYIEKGSTKYMINGSLNKYKSSGWIRLWEISKLKPGALNTFTTYPWSSVASNILSYPTANFKVAATFDSYDTYGNPLTKIGSDGITETYTWANSNTLLGSVTQNAGTYQHQTAYQQKPLTGVTRITDPNNLNTYYEYDGSRRLKLVKDYNNHIMTRYRYHYKNQRETLEASILVTGAQFATSTTTFSTAYQYSDYGTTTYTWNFGDGSAPVSGTTSRTVNHIYSSAGTYTVTLTVSNPGHGTASSSLKVIIEPAFTASVCADGLVTTDLCVYNSGGNGSCTTGNYPGQTIVKAAASGTCSISAYIWESSPDGSTWNPFGGSSDSVPLPWGVASCSQFTGYIRCRVTNTCGVTAASSALFINFYKSNSTCQLQCN